jgi:transglutaminase-like putative cysteine protease
MTTADGLDWSRVSAATYRIEQSLRYEYASPIANLRHRLVIVPRAAHGDQLRLSRELTASPVGPFEISHDAFGNEVAELALDRVEKQLTFTLASTVRRRGGAEHVVGGVHVENPVYRSDRRLLRADEMLADAAADIWAIHPNPHDRAAAIVRFVHGHFTYTKSVTDVFTTAAVAFRMRRGVCQDYAHVTIALARACGLTARYVSGHLIGEGATHAWVEFVIPRRDGTAVVESYDPTQGRPTSLRYVTIAVGRDYDDVAPTSGVFTGPAGGKLRGQQRLILLDVEAA